MLFDQPVEIAEMNYTQITQEERYQIYALKKAGLCQSKMAKVLGRSPSTISRELKRNIGLRGYRPSQAHVKSAERKAVNALRIDDAIWAFAREKLLEEWSPEQISGQAEISHETIYQRIYADKRDGGLLWKQLRCQKQRKKRDGKLDRRGIIPNRLSIDERPSIVQTRARVGDWEADTIIGKQHKMAIVSLVERKTGVTLIQRVTRKTADEVSAAMIRLMTPLKSQVATITSDNGREFAGHEKVTRLLSADFYFAHPYSSWERGTNENTSGLIRQYFPKDRDFRTITDEEIETAMRRLNHRPRKRYGFKSPHQVFLELTGVALRT
jgi:IS30 family transposase